MSNPPENGVCDNKCSNKKGVCDQCGVLRYCDAHPNCQPKMNHKHFGTHIQPEIEQEKGKLNRTTIYHRIYRLILTDEL